MELKLDTSVPYALALEGGGAKGAHQIGAWRALKEAGVQICAVSGTSVGAINGAFITMDKFEQAQTMWEQIRYSQIMDVDDETMQTLLSGNLRNVDIKQVVSQLAALVKNKGFDINPLEELLTANICEQTIRSSPIEYYIVTCQVDPIRTLELRAKSLTREGEIIDMILASAYLPVFRREEFDGKRYTDGGLRDVLPLHVLIENGYKNIIALRLFGIGFERPLRVPRSVSLHTVIPSVDLGSTLEFDAARSRQNMLAGYYDAKRLLYGLSGSRWYIDSCWSEMQAYQFLLCMLSPHRVAQRQTISMREINEAVLPRLSRTLSTAKDTYLELAVACLEEAAERSTLPRFQIYTEQQLLDRLLANGVPLLSPELTEILFARYNRFPLRRSRARTQSPET